MAYGTYGEIFALIPDEILKRAHKRTEEFVNDQLKQLENSKKVVKAPMTSVVHEAFDEINTFFKLKIELVEQKLYAEGSGWYTWGFNKDAFLKIFSKEMVNQILYKVDELCDEHPQLSWECPANTFDVTLIYTPDEK